MKKWPQGLARYASYLAVASVAGVFIWLGAVGGKGSVLGKADGEQIDPSAVPCLSIVGSFLYQGMNDAPFEWSDILPYADGKAAVLTPRDVTVQGWAQEFAKLLMIAHRVRISEHEAFVSAQEFLPIFLRSLNIGNPQALPPGLTPPKEFINLSRVLELQEMSRPDLSGQSRFVGVADLQEQDNARYVSAPERFMLNLAIRALKSLATVMINEAASCGGAGDAPSSSLEQALVAALAELPHIEVQLPELPPFPQTDFLRGRVVLHSDNQESERSLQQNLEIVQDALWQHYLEVVLPSRRPPPPSPTPTAAMTPEQEAAGNSGETAVEAAVRLAQERIANSTATPTPPGVGYLGIVSAREQSSPSPTPVPIVEQPTPTQPPQMNGSTPTPTPIPTSTSTPVPTAAATPTPRATVRPTATPILPRIPTPTPTPKNGVKKLPPKNQLPKK